MSFSDTIKETLAKLGLTPEQVATVEQEVVTQAAAKTSPVEPSSQPAAPEPEPVPQTATQPLPPPHVSEGLTEAELAALAGGKPDANAPENPSLIAPTKPATVEELQVELLALKARFERLVRENYNSHMGY